MPRLKLPQWATQAGFVLRLSRSSKNGLQADTKWGSMTEPARRMAVAATSVCVVVRARATRCLSALAIAMALIAGSAPAEASAEAWSELTSADQRTIVNAFYKATGHAQPYAAEAERGGALATSLTEAGQKGAPGTQRIAKAEIQGTTQVRLLPALKDLARQIPRKVGSRFVVTAIVASEVDLGFYIYARLTTHDIGSDGFWTYEDISYYPEGHDIYYGAQSRGEWLFNGRYSGSSRFTPIRWFEAPCTFSGFTAAPGAHLRTGVPSTAKCSYSIDVPPYSAEADVLVDYPYLTAKDIAATATLSKHKPGEKPYDYSFGAVPAPDASVTTQLIGEFLDSPEGAPIRNQILWSMGADGGDTMTEPIQAPDAPTTTGPTTESAPPDTPPETDSRRWCERTAPGVTDVTLPSDTNEFTIWESYDTSSGVPTDMLHGTELLGNPDIDYAWRSIQGFGLRKIIRKHGWTAADRDDTKSALLMPPTLVYPPEHTLGRKYGRVEYRGAFYNFPDPTRVPLGTPDGRCQRVVAINTKAIEGEPKSRGIVTSYAEYVR